MVLRSNNNITQNPIYDEKENTEASHNQVLRNNYKGQMDVIANNDLHKHPKNVIIFHELRMGILEEWVENYDEFLNNQKIGKLEVPPIESDGRLLPPPSMEEVRAIHWLKNNKSSRPGGITVALEATIYTKQLNNWWSVF